MRTPSLAALLAIVGLGLPASGAPPVRRKPSTAPGLTAVPPAGSRPVGREVGENLKPALAAARRGGYVLAWARREGDATSIQVATSTDGLSFTAPVRVSRPDMDLDLGAESGPQLASGPDGEVYVTWVAGSWKVPSTGHAARSGGTAHPGSGSGRGGPPPRPGNLNVYLAVSRDDGRTFGPPIKVNDDPDGAEHRFPTLAVGSDGTLHAAWLDKRLQTGDRPDFARVFYARSTDGGRTFQRNVDATAGQPNGICHCCRIGLALDPSGRPVIAFRNDVEDLRDIFWVRPSSDGSAFTQPEPIEQIRWKIGSCPFNGPSFGFDNRGHAVFTWMSGGEVTGPPQIGARTGVSYKVMTRDFDSRSGAWGPVRFLSEGAHPRTVVSHDGRSWLAWEQDGIRLAETEYGAAAPRRIIRLTAPEASAGFPALALGRDGAVLAAWQQRASDDRWQIRTMALSPAGRAR